MCVLGRGGGGGGGQKVPDFFDIEANGTKLGKAI